MSDDWSDGEGNQKLWCLGAMIVRDSIRRSPKRKTLLTAKGMVRSGPNPCGDGTILNNYTA